MCHDFVRGIFEKHIISFIAAIHVYSMVTTHFHKWFNYSTILGLGQQGFISAQHNTTVLMICMSIWPNVCGHMWFFCPNVTTILKAHCCLECLCVL